MAAPVTRLLGDFPRVTALFPPSCGGEITFADAVGSLACVAVRGWRGVDGLALFLRGELHLH